MARPFHTIKARDQYLLHAFLVAGWLESTLCIRVTGKDTRSTIRI